MTQSTVKQSDAGTLTQTMLSDVQRNARTFSCKMLPLCVKEIPTDVKKLETKIIRKTRSRANQFDAETLAQALQTKVERHAQTVSYRILLLFVKEIHKHITTKLETKTIRQTQSIENQFDPGTLTEALQTELEGNAQSGAKNHHCLSNRFQRTPQNWKQKSPKTRATKNQFEPGTMNHALEIELKPNSRKVS